MDFKERKYHVIEDLMKVEDEAVIYKVEALLKKERVEAYEKSLKPMTQEELEARLAKSEEDFKMGRYTELDDLIKESESW
jgi:hypothetical protein